MKVESMIISRSEIQDAIETAIDLCASAGNKLVKSYGNIEFHHKNKSGLSTSTDAVTLLDGWVETFLVDNLPTFGKQIGFLGEEMGSLGSKSNFWLIDPIDGTSHFIRGLPFCTIMVALILDGKPQGSVIYDIASQDAYWAIEGKGAFCNDQRIYVSTRGLEDALIVYDGKTSTDRDKYRFNTFQELTKGLFCTLNSGYEFAMIASGKIDARVCFNPYGSIWDYVPGALLVQEAGGIVANVPFQDNYQIKNLNFIAANPALFDSIKIIMNDLI